MCIHTHAHKDALFHTDTSTPRTHFIIIGTVTGETFRGKERGALNNECEEPCYTADKPLK